MCVITKDYLPVVTKGVHCSALHVKFLGLEGAVLPGSTGRCGWIGPHKHVRQRSTARHELDQANAAAMRHRRRIREVVC